MRSKGDVDVGAIARSVRRRRPHGTPPAAPRPASWRCCRTPSQLLVEKRTKPQRHRVTEKTQGFDPDVGVWIRIVVESAWHRGLITELVTSRATVPPPQIDGVLVVHKPVGPTSHDVVVVRAAIARRQPDRPHRHARSAGVGRAAAGPRAGDAARAAPDGDRTRNTRRRFALASRPTPTTRRDDGPARDAARCRPRTTLDAALERFRGAFDQTPPVYSAKMVDGERAYALARAVGKPVQPAAVAVDVARARAAALRRRRGRACGVRCSAGFYVRSLAHDLGQALGIGAILDGLVRTEPAGFALDDAVPFERTGHGAARRGSRARVAARWRRCCRDDPGGRRLTAGGRRWALHGRDLGPRALAWRSARRDVTGGAGRGLLAPDGRMRGAGRTGKNARAFCTLPWFSATIERFSAT